MRRSLAALSLAAVAALLAGCTVTAPTAAPSSGDATTTTTPSPAETRLVVGIQAVGYAHDGDTTVVSYTEAEKLQDLLRSISDQDPEQTAVDGPPGYEMQMTRYDYGGITLTSGPDGPASIAVETATFHGVPVATQEGISVGSTRAEAMDAGARDGYDQDGDGIADWLDLGSVEISGTQSLVNPGSVGIQFVMLGLDGDTVRELQAPANDFSDL
ncbi:hypothetical protein [Microbacterium sp. Clip185]|uniref:hypothetical protein n=1 Tax=Microbacterium sp. Clip185 TaxID=3025663 RepID=UPI002366734B|nr:hypothetical protein [Microbacterium sp. Clip185]WDG16982.1 hypothetical protein PQV94_10045 [Microbacterium sp. Clip185]